jgi:hypothetical protein
MRSDMIVRRIRRIKGMTLIFLSEEVIKEVLENVEMEDINDVNKESN